MSICVKLCKDECTVDCKENVNLQDLIYENNEGERLYKLDVLPQSSLVVIEYNYYYI